MNTATLTLILMFGAIVTAVFGILSIIADFAKGDRARMRRRIEEVSRDTMRERVKKSALFKDLGQLAAAAPLPGETVPSLQQRFVTMVDQSGLNLSPNALVAVCAVSGLALATLGFVLLRSLLFLPLIFAAGAVLPILYVRRRRDRRLEKLLSQLPEAFDLMGRVIRAGQTIGQAFRSVADEFPPPISTEFSFCFEQQNLGIPPGTALRDLAQRTGLLDLKILVVGVVVQEQTGGNLAEMLDNLSALIRERFRMRGMIKTLTAEGRLQALLLLGLPPAMFLFMLIVNPKYAMELFDHPILILVTIVSEALGGLWIRSIVNFSV